MVVLILESVPASLRGELTRWLVKVDAGVFVGTLSATVRQLLWEKCVEKSRGGRCCMVYRTNNEQGFAVQIAGYQDKVVRDFDGLLLMTERNAEALRKARRIQARMKLGTS